MFVESEPNVLQSRSILHSFDENKSGICMNNEYKAQSNVNQMMWLIKHMLEAMFHSKMRPK